MTNQRSTINGMTTVNGDIIVRVANMDVEMLCRSISGHRANILVAYIKEDGKKVTVSYYNDQGNRGFEVYKYKSLDSLEQYWSRNYGYDIPKKYMELGDKLRTAHRLLFLK